MDISQRGIDLIKDYESYSGEAYLCPEGVPTIGWGSIRWDAKTPVRIGDKCTEQQAETLLRKEIQRIEDAIDTHVRVPLTQGQFDCLCSWGYNVGTGWINGQRKGGAATLIGYLNKGQYDKVPSELLKFKRGAVSGKSYNGLLNRRKRELAELWFADVESDVAAAKPPMPQQVEPETGNVKDAVKTSWTLKGALLAFVATMSETAVDVYNWTFGVAKDAGVELTAIRQTVGPFDTILVTMKSALPVLAVVGIVIVVSRRLSAAREGRTG